MKIKPETVLKDLFLSWVWFRFMVFYATFSNISVISWRSVLLVEESAENHWPAAGDKLIVWST